MKRTPCLAGRFMAFCLQHYWAVIMINHDSSFNLLFFLRIERDWNHDLVPAQEWRFSHGIWRSLKNRRNSPWKTCSSQTHRNTRRFQAWTTGASSVFALLILTNLKILCGFRSIIHFKRQIWSHETGHLFINRRCYMALKMWYQFPVFPSELWSFSAWPYVAI